MSKRSEKYPATDKPCGFIRRLAIMLYDSLAIIALLMLVTAVAMLLGMENQTAGKDPLYSSGLVLVWFFYLAWCWRNGGMTLGMRAWRVNIKSDYGDRPGWGQCAIRFLVSGLSALAGGLGFLWSLFRSDRQTWHDLASNTQLYYQPKIKLSDAE